MLSESCLFGYKRPTFDVIPTGEVGWLESIGGRAFDLLPEAAETKKSITFAANLATYGQRIQQKENLQRPHLWLR